MQLVVVGFVSIFVTSSIRMAIRHITESWRCEMDTEKGLSLGVRIRHGESIRQIGVMVSEVEGKPGSYLVSVSDTLRMLSTATAGSWAEALTKVRTILAELEAE